MCTHELCMYKWRSEVKVGYLSITPLYLICLDKVSLNLEITVLARLSGQGAPESHCLPSAYTTRPGCWKYRLKLHACIAPPQPVMNILTHVLCPCLSLPFTPIHMHREYIYMNISEDKYVSRNVRNIRAYTFF